MEPTSSKPAQLSCTNCRHRKVKCDKTAPCSACRRSNIECVFPTRPFKPRGKQGGSRARNVEIAKRLNRLEGLMSKLGGEGAAHALLQEADARDDSSDSQRPEPRRQSSSQSPQSPSSKGPEPLLKTDGTRSLSSNFWSSLSGEVSLPGMSFVWVPFECVGSRLNMSMVGPYQTIPTVICRQSSSFLRSHS